MSLEVFALVYFAGARAPDSAAACQTNEFALVNGVSTLIKFTQGLINLRSITINEGRSELIVSSNLICKHL